MQVPLTVSFQGLTVDERIRTLCWSEAEKLSRFHHRLTSCHVTLSRSHRHRHGNHYDVRVRCAVPGGEVVVSRSPASHATDEHAELAVREAFAEARRQLQDNARRVRGDERHPE